jgi:inhibitor of KinA sporulation pathway (predicted exonuclease)
MTDLPRAPHTIVFDLEFTAWDGSMAASWLRPEEFKEVVQIGAVKVDEAFELLETFDVLVRPRINPIMSVFLENLTGITNDDVRARGIDFLEAYRRFISFAGGLPVLAFGRDDLVLAANFRLYGIREAPPLPPYVNVMEWMTHKGFDMRGRHACDVGPMAGVPFEGRKHNALHDALSVATGIRALVSRGVPSPVVR